MKKNSLLFMFMALMIMSCEKEEETVYLTATFEDAESSELASSLYGENLYGGLYPGYTDTTTDLFIGLLDKELYNGGIALSQWNDMDSAGYTNQCSVYYRDGKSGFGGNNGSKTFAVSNGYKNSFSDTRPVVGFKTEGTEKIFDHFYVNNSTYTYLCMSEGDAFCRRFSYNDKDWFKLIITGLDNEGRETGEIEFYLADFRTPQSKGIVTKWTKVDLSSLGRIHQLRFNLDSNVANDFGMAVPAYFCFDDVTVQE